MGFMKSLFGGDPGAAAGRELDKIPGILSDHFQSYIDQGHQAGGALQDEYSGMMGDPSAFINALMKQYKPSEGYQFQQNAMGQSAENAAAAGGQIGGASDQAEQQRITQGLLGQDMQGWLQNVLGVHTQGMAGEQDVYNKGYSADASMADSLANLQGTRATNAYNSANRPTGFMQGLNMAAGIGGAAMGLPTGLGGSVGGDLFKKWGL